jgi:glycine cleavage system aminomethyltransferase T
MHPPALKAEHERYARVEQLRLGGVPVEVEWMPYGSSADGAAGPEIVAGYGLLELEYAAFRRGAAVVDRSCRGTIAVWGADRVELMNRLVTQELKGMAAGDVRAGFLLNRKGRIDADLLFAEVPEPGDLPPMLVDVDVHDAAAAAAAIAGFVFSEDVRVEDQSSQWARLAVHGPG